MSEDHKASHSADKHRDREAGILDEAKERIADMTDEARARGEKLIEQAKDRGNKLWDEAQDQGKQSWKGIQTLIQKNPGKAVGYAVVLGAALYALFGRKEKKR